MTLNGFSEIEGQFEVMERYRKSWKAAEEEERYVQISTATTEVRTIEHMADNEIRTPRTRGKRIATSPAESLESKKRRNRCDRTPIMLC